MRKLLVCVLLAGCAQEPNQTQLAILSYYKDLCLRQGVPLEDKLALRGCIFRNYQIDVASGAYRSQGNVVQELSNVYGSAVPRANCSIRPDYAGGWVTTCY